MEFREFAERASAIEATDADLEVVSLVADLLAAADSDLDVVARFVQGRVFPAWSSRTLDVGPSLCYEALARAAGPNVDADDVEDRLADLGDVGAVAASLDLGGQTGLDAFAVGDSGADGAGADGRTVGEVFEELERLAAADGAGSQDRKLDGLFGLFGDCSPGEARYLARLVLGEMRIGVGEGTVRDAIAEAFDVPVDAVARALQVTNDYGLVAERARDGGRTSDENAATEAGARGESDEHRESDAGEAALDDLHLAVGRPVQAMLAQAGTVTEALDDWEAVAVETKLDGARVQVHYAEPGEAEGQAAEGSTTTVGDVEGADSDQTDADHASDEPRGEIGLYSRNMEDVTDALPEIVEFVAANCRPPAILDGEVVAVDEDGEPLPFQEVLRRFRRKHDVQDARADVATELHVFDCLHAPADLVDEVDVDAGGAGGVPAGDADDVATGDAGEAAESVTGAAEADVAGDGDDGADDVDDAATGQAGLGEFTDDGQAEHAAGDEDDGPLVDDGDDNDDGDEAIDDAVSTPSGPTVRGDGVDLLDAPLRERRAYLEALVDDGVVPATITDDPDEIEAREERALAAGHEGIMLKNPASTYTPGRRGKDWLKRKPDVETLDLVVTGAEWGEGRRAELLGTYHLAARTDDGFARVGNVATGITDEELADLHERMLEHVEAERGQAVELEPAVVFEVGYEEIQRSPTYDAGYALRFPRFVGVRDDLDPGDADSLARVERLAGE